MRRLLLLLLIPIQSVLGQSEIPLDSCYNWARENYPNLKQAEIWQEISNLKQEYPSSVTPDVSLPGKCLTYTIHYILPYLIISPKFEFSNNLKFYFA